MFHGFWDEQQQQQQSPRPAQPQQQQAPQQLSARLRCQPSPRLDRKTKAHLTKLLHDAANRAWCRVHGKSLPPPKLPPVVLRVIGEWFQLVDDDASGTLEHHELLAALQAARIPCSADSITEMIRLMDANRDGCISWAEFERFMMAEFAAGQQLLSGEFVLPSGMALPFGDIIRQLKRAQMIADVTGGGEARRKWLFADINLTAAAAEIAQAEEAIRAQKAFNETLHTACLAPAKQQEQEQQQGAQGLPHTQQPAQRNTCACSGGGVADVNDSPAGRPAAAGGGGASPHADCGSSSSSRQPWQKPDRVPRLQLSSLTSSEGRTAHGSVGRGSSLGSQRPLIGLLSAPQAAALLGCLPGSLRQLQGSPRLVSARSSGPGDSSMGVIPAGASMQSARVRHAAPGGPQPQPSREAWCTAAASCLARRQSCALRQHAAVQDRDSSLSSSHRQAPSPPHWQQQADASRGCGSARLRHWEHVSAPAASSARRNSRACAVPQAASATAPCQHPVSMQQRGQRCQGGSRPQQLQRPAQQRQPEVRPDGDVLAASRESLLSARALPPGVLLASNFVGPVAAAIAIAHTPRSQR